MSLYAELKRRNVFRVGILYVVGAWLVLQIADVAISLLALPEWSGRLVFMLVALGFVPAIIFSWLYELTPEGLKREHAVDRSASITGQTGRKIDALIAVFGVLVVGVIVADRLIPDRATVTTSAAHGANAAQADPSIAVLPFVNMSGDASQEFFSDGLSEELLNVLAQIQGLRVAARTSSFQFKGQNRDVGGIARTLGVAHILEGSVRKAGERVRITAQLISAADGFHLWSQTYDRNLTDIFQIQEDIARAVGGELQSRLGLAPDGVASVSPRIIAAANPQAFEAYLQGRQLINRRGKANLEEAVGHLERALRLDSDFAPAHAQLAIATTMLLRHPSTYGDLTLAQVKAKALPHIERALALAPDLAEAHGAQALLALVQLDDEAAIRHAERAAQLNPSYIDALAWLTISYERNGRYAEVLHGSERLLRLDPGSVIGRHNHVGNLYAMGRFEEARSLARELTATHPWAGHAALGKMLLEGTGELTEGIEVTLRAHALEPSDQLANSLLAFGFGWLDLMAEAVRIGDHVIYDAHFAGRDYDAAIDAANANIALDPGNSEPVAQLATALHRAGRVEEASEHLERLLQSQQGRILFDPLLSDAMPTLRLAFARRARGDHAGADHLVQQVQSDQEARRRAGRTDHPMESTDAMIAALRGDTAETVAALDRAVARGLRDRGVFDEPVFAPMLDDPAVIAVRDRLDSILAEEREKTLRLICHNNPVPDAWQPHPDTCAGVTL